MRKRTAPPKRKASGKKPTRKPTAQKHSPVRMGDAMPERGPIGRAIDRFMGRG